MPTIHDVAERAGVSISTVSRSFTTKGLISDKTVERVLDAARELNYRPRPSTSVRKSHKRARTDSDNASTATAVRDTIGFQFFASMPEDTLAVNGFYAQVFSGVQLETSGAQVNLLVHTTDRHALLTGKPLMIDEQSVQGILLVGTTDPEVVSAFALRVPQMVLVDSPDPVSTHDSIQSDGFEGGYVATCHLIEQGHRRIAFFDPEEGVPTFRDRRRGYLAALAEARIPVDYDLFFTYSGGDYSLNENFLTARLIANQASDRGATAIVAANDFYAFQAIHVCRRLNLRVPEDISVIGFDDAPECVVSAPPLTSVRFDRVSMGRLAVRRLLSRMDEARQDIPPTPPCRYVIPVSLVVRESTAPPALGQ